MLGGNKSYSDLVTYRSVMYRLRIDRDILDNNILAKRQSCNDAKPKSKCARADIRVNVQK